VKSINHKAPRHVVLSDNVCAYHFYLGNITFLL